MMNDIEVYNYPNITKALLDSIEVGDQVKINDWDEFLQVYAVTPNYFVMARKISSEITPYEYSVCEKKVRTAGRYNDMMPGYYHVGPDAWLFGAPVWCKYTDGGKYDFENQEAVQAYANSFEDAELNRLHDNYDPEPSRISERSGAAIRTIAIKRRCVA